MITRATIKASGPVGYSLNDCGKKMTKEEVLAEVWHRFSRAVTERTRFTVMQIATIGRDEAPKLRSIVIRCVNKQTASLSFITDRRSPKVREIYENPSVSLLAFDSDTSVQLRMEGLATVIEDEKRKRSVWESLHNHTHILFGSPLVPGTPVSSPMAVSQIYDPKTAYEQFCLIEIYLSSIDWLHVGMEPQMRCRFERESERWIGIWLVP
ncbi:pyridoxamine 5'-phosphate oxidase family protein [Brucella pseudogrignonensis]